MFSRLRRRWLRPALGLLLLSVLGLHAAEYQRLDLLSRLDAIFYDTRLRLTLPGGVDERIVIIDIDEQSLAEEGRWPWPRYRLAQLVDIVFEQQNASLLAFDVVFAEPDRSSGIDVLTALAHNELRHDQEFLQALERLSPSLDYDARFADSLKNRPVVLGYYLSHSAQSTGAVPDAVLPEGSFGKRPLAVTRWHSHGGNLPELQAAAMSAGFFNPLVDFDGIVRRVPLLAEYDGEYYEALSLAVVRALLDFPPIFPGLAAGGDGYAGLEWLDLPGEERDLRLPVDENIAALVPYRGKQGSFLYVSASDLLRGRIPANALAGKVALVGTSAPGLVDLRATPVGEAFPGVEIQANLIAGMLDAGLKQKPEYAVGFDLLVMIMTGLLLIFLLPRLSAARSTLFAVALLLFLLALDLALWQWLDLALPIAASLALVASLYVWNIAWGYFFEARTKRQLTSLFGQYVPPELVEQMSADPENYSMTGRKAELTVFFSDVRGFTSISENLPPELLAELMNLYLAAMTQIIREHQGTLDKYIGDAIMAFWGAPVQNPMHARQAVHAALAMRAAMPELNRELLSRGWPALTIGMGINTGWVTVGDMGSPVRQSYTVMGDAVNLAARLEGITKQYGVGLIIGEATLAQLGEEFLVRELDRVRVKGKTEPVRIYEPVIASDQATPEQRQELAQWARALEAYRHRQWAEAQLLLEKLQQGADRSLYAMYLQRIEHYLRHPPEKLWDGVHSLTEK